MLEDLKLYPKFLSISIRSQMQYRFAFLFGFFSFLIYNSFTLATIWIVLAKFKSLAGWSFWEIVLLYSMWKIGNVLGLILVGQLTPLETLIVSGSFDRYLLSPASSFMQIVSRRFYYLGFGDLAISFTLFSIAYFKLGLNWAVAKFALLLVFILSAMIIESSLRVIVASIAFWTGRASGIRNVLFQLNTLIQQYPLDMFNNWFSLLVTSVLPFAFMNYYPIAALLDKQNAFNLPILNYLSPLVAVVSMLLASFIWRQGINHYGSTGS